MSEYTRSHKHQIELPASAETVFTALIKPSAICVWWQASSAIVLPGKDGFWTATWGDRDDPDYITWHRITAYEFPKFIELGEGRYVTKFEPPPFELDLTARFDVEPVSEKRSVLKVLQTGFPMDEVADEFYAGCETGWNNTFEGMRRFIDDLNKNR